MILLLGGPEHGRRVPAPNLPEFIKVAIPTEDLLICEQVVYRRTVIRKDGRDLIVYVWAERLPKEFPDPARRDMV